MAVSKSTHITLLKLSIATILAAWSCIWILKPTRVWKMSWHTAEDWADSTFLREPGLNAIVFCLPLLAVAVLGYIYLHLCVWDGNIRKKTHFIAKIYSNPLIVSGPIGVISGYELMAAALFITFLTWTYYSDLSSDLKKMVPSNSLQQNRWQIRVMATGVRFGSLTEACLAILLLPVLRGMSVFSMLGIQFEASVRYHVWLGNAIMFFSVLHSSIIMYVWGSKNSLWMEARVHSLLEIKISVI